MSPRVYLLASALLAIAHSPAADLGGVLSVYQVLGHYPYTDASYYNPADVDSDDSFGDSVQNFSGLPGSFGSEFYKATILDLGNGYRSYTLECGADFTASPETVSGGNFGTWFGDWLQLDSLPGPEGSAPPVGPFTIRFHFHVVGYYPDGAENGNVEVFVGCSFSRSWDNGHGSQTITDGYAAVNQIFDSPTFDWDFGDPFLLQVKLAMQGSGTGPGLVPHASRRANLSYAGATLYDGAGNPVDPSLWIIHRVGASGTGQAESVVSAVPPPSAVTLTIAPVPDHADQMNLLFSPIVPGYTYTVESKPDLTSASWQPLTGTTSLDIGPTRTVTDLDAGANRKFYRVVVTAP
jgi:hypothetical protein